MHILQQPPPIELEAMMPIDLLCEGCGRKITIRDEFAGRRGACSQCGAAILVPGPPTGPPGPELQTEAPSPGHVVTFKAWAAAGAALALPGLATFGLYLGIARANRREAGTPEGEPRKVAGVHSTAVEAEKIQVIPARAPAESGQIVRPAGTIAVVGRPGGGPTDSEAEGRRSGLEEIVSRCEASVAVIRGPNSAGSGFLASLGLVATNAHVIRRTPAGDIRVSFPAAPPGQKGPHKAVVVYFDDNRDLAVLAVDSQLSPLTIRGDHAFRRGQEVVFIGNPVIGGSKILESVATRGILGSRTYLDDLDYYQLSGSVNGGNSGGPVIDMDGRVIGVVTARAAKEEGIGFCIPAADLAVAVVTASRRDPAAQSEASTRHANTARLATIRVARTGSVERGDEGAVSQFLKTTEPATWIASADSNLILKDTSPRVTPFRNSLRKVDTIYLEDDRTIALLTIQHVTKVREAGLPLSCASLLGTAQTWAPPGYLRGGTARSFLTFAETYCDFRINERLDHRATIARMQPSQVSPSLASPEEVPDPSAQAGSRPVSKTRPNPRTPPPAGDAGPAAPTSPAGRLQIAGNLEASGDKGSAILGYETIIDKFPLTSQADEARKRLKILKQD